jgi:hypothetical protein
MGGGPSNWTYQTRLIVKRGDSGSYNTIVVTVLWQEEKRRRERCAGKPGKGELNKFSAQRSAPEINHDIN